MKQSKTPIHYLVGTPKGRLSKLENDLLKLPWEQVKEDVEVKLLEKDDEIYVLAKSRKRVLKECSMRQRRLKKLWNRLKELQGKNIKRDTLLIKIGATKKEAGRTFSLLKINLPSQDEEVSKDTFTFSLLKEKLRTTRRREGNYLLRSNMKSADPGKL